MKQKRIESLRDTELQLKTSANILIILDSTELVVSYIDITLNFKNNIQLFDLKNQWTIKYTSI